MKQKRIFLHIGAHKTASTMLQLALLKSENLVVAQQDAVAFVSVHHAAPDSAAFRLGFTQLRNRMMQLHYAGKPVPDPMVQKMSDLIAAFINTVPQDHIVISSENLLGNTLGHPAGPMQESCGKLYPASPEIAVAFQMALEPHQVRVRLYSRAFESLIRSSYCDWIMKLRTAITLQQFRDRLEPETLNWDRVAQPWRDQFGADFSMRPFESIRDGQDGFLREFADWCGLRLAPDVSFAQAQQINKSFSQRQIDFALTTIPLVHKDERTRLRRFILSLDED